MTTLSLEQIARLRGAGIEEHYVQGATLVIAGWTGPFFVVLEGEVEAIAAHTDPVVYGPGEFVGEMAVILGAPSIETVTAKTAVRVLRVPRRDLRGIIQTDTDLSDAIVHAALLRRAALVTANAGNTVVVGGRDAGTLRLREFLTRNEYPYRYLDARDPTVWLLAAKLGATETPLLIHDGQVWTNPPNYTVAAALGLNDGVDPAVVYDVAIVGAGPGGLAAAVLAASEGLSVLVIESNAPGGQAGCSSKIENYLGFPMGVSGQELAARAVTQAEKFGAQISVARGATALHCEESPCRIALEDGSQAHARVVVIATGAAYSKLDVPSLARFEGAGVYYAATAIEAQCCGSDEVVVVGGGNSAGQAAVYLARSAKHVHMLIRGESLAATMSSYLIRRIENTPNITLHTHTEIDSLQGDTHLRSVAWYDRRKNEISNHEIRHVFSMIGAKPNTEWLRGCLEMDASGFIKTGVDLSPSTPLFQTSHPRVFAVGDVRANSVKRVASAVGEGSVCIQLVHKVLTES